MCTLSSWVKWDQESETIIWNIFLCRSDPTENDSVEGLRPNARGPGLVTFGVSKILVLLEYLQRVLLWLNCWVLQVLLHTLQLLTFDSHFLFSSLTGSWSSVRTMISSLLSELMNAWWMGLSDLLKVTSLLCSLPQIIVVSHFLFPPNHIVFRLLSPGTFRKRSRQRRGRNWIKIRIFFLFGGFFHKCRDSQQCRSNSGSWTGPGSGAQAYPPYPTCHSFPWVITRTPPRRDVDAGENTCIIYLAFTWVTSALNFTFRT